MRAWIVGTVGIVIAVGCGDSQPPPSAFGVAPSGFPVDAGPTRVCGVVPGSTCEGSGEITRCLCGSFEEQIGRFVCCRDGVAVALECQRSGDARDCDGKPAARVDAGAD